MILSTEVNRNHHDSLSGTSRASRAILLYSDAPVTDWKIIKSVIRRENREESPKKIIRTRTRIRIPRRLFLLERETKKDRGKRRQEKKPNIAYHIIHIPVTKT